MIDKVILRIYMIATLAPYDCIKQYFDYCECDTSVLNKCRKVKLMIVALREYASKKKCGVKNTSEIVLGN